MIAPLRYSGQALVYALLAVTIGVLATRPTYTRVPPDQALIKFTLVHAAVKKGECRRVSAEELAKLAPNMRRPTICPRERLPVATELELAGKVIYTAVLPPTGLTGDGPSRAYERFVVPAGHYRLVARLRDSDRVEGFDYVTETDVDLRPGQSLAVDFFPVSGGFRFE
jgi:hypothetical protein